MKIRVLTTYLLLLLMTIQSVATQADAHAEHQSGTEHLSFEDHQHPANPDHFSSPELFEDQERDCHHCCHCHGHFSPAILISAHGISLFKNSSPVPDYSENTFPDPLEAFLRPPKA